jgi:peptidyl-prolyl cis-trans isomerase A (cyclophilin A)
MVAIIDTSAGQLRCSLFPEAAPIGVANFIGLADGSKDWINPVNHKRYQGVSLYDGTIFHRVIPGFMIQGGDPAGNGTGDPGYKFKNEVSSMLLFDRPGRLAYANSGPDTNGSQFFITEVATPHLNGNYTIFGQCDEPSVELVKQIARMPGNADDRPDHPIKINHITFADLEIASQIAQPHVNAPPAAVSNSPALSDSEASKVNADIAQTVDQLGGTWAAQCNAVNRAVRVESKGPLDGPGDCPNQVNAWFTNISGSKIDCKVIFHKGGIWDTTSGLDFALTPGQKVGGFLSPGGIWTCRADSGWVQYACFPHSEGFNACLGTVRWGSSPPGSGAGNASRNSSPPTQPQAKKPTTPPCPSPPCTAR